MSSDIDIDKAIELNEESEKSLRDHKFIDHANAIALGDEALKVLRHGRTIGAHVDPIKLPGETVKGG